MAEEKKSKKDKNPEVEVNKDKVKFEIYGEEMIEKTVKLSGNSGRVYLPPNWVGHHVKIIRPWTRLRSRNTHAAGASGRCRTARCDS